MATQQKNNNQNFKEIIRLVKTFDKSYFVFLFNENLEIVALNNEAVKLLNENKKGDIEGRDIQEVMDKKYAQNFSKNLKQTFKNKKTIDLENNFLLKDKEITVDTVLSPIKDSSSQPVFVLSISRNISYFKEYKKIKAEKDKYQYLFENSQNMLFGISSSAKMIEINQTALDILGYKKEDVIGKKFRKFVPFKYVPRLLKDLAMELAGGKAKPITIEIKSKKGKLIPVDLYPGSVPIYNKNKKTIGIMITGRDVSSKTEIEKELEESEKKFKFLFNQLNDGFAYFKPIFNKKGEMIDSEYLEINQAYAELINHPQAKIIGKRVSEVLSEQDREMFKNFEKVVKTGEKINFEVYNNNKQKYYKINSFAPQKNTYAIIFRDITLQKRNEHVMQIQRDLAISLGEVSNLKEAADIFLNKIQEFKEVDGGGLYIFDEKGNLKLVSSKGLSKEFVNATKSYKPDSPQAKIARKGESIFTNYSKLDIKKGPKKEAEKIKAFAIIPLKDKDEIMGSVNIISKNFESFDENNVKVLEIIASRMEGVFGRIKKEKIIKTSEEKYKILAETQKEGVAMVNKNCVIQYINPALSRLLGYSSQEILGKNLKDFFASSSTEKIIDQCKEKIKKREIDSDNKEFEILKKDNSIIVVEISFTPIFKNEKINGFHLTIRDITERKKAERELKQKVEELEQINRLLVGRELKMIELKKKLSRLERRSQE